MRVPHFFSSPLEDQVERNPIADELVCVGLFRMAFVILAAVLGLSGWPIYRVVAELRRHNFAPVWWVGFAFLLVLGLCVGIWAGVLLEYQPNARLRIQGFPMPLGIFVWEQDRWTDFVPHRVVQYGAVLANVLAAIALAITPLGIVARMTRRRTE